MRPAEFKLERYFAEYEFQVEHLLSASDCESMSLNELLGMAGAAEKRRWEEIRLGYTESAGRPELRAEIAALYPGLGIESVLTVVPGEGIFIAFNSILEPGDQVIVVSPAYQSLLEIPKAIGCEVIQWPLLADEGGWRLELEFLERSITPRTKLVVVNFPHNPTGFLPSREFFGNLVELARKNGLYLFSDEMYWLSEYCSDSRLPAAATVYERGISLFGLSKTFGLPGLRTGWLVTRDRELMERFVMMKDYTTICGSPLNEVPAIIALKARDRIISRNLAIIRDNLNRVEHFFAKHEDWFGWIPPQAGPVCFPELRADAPVADFCRRVVQTKGVMILPGTVFDYPGNRFRLGLGRQGFSAALSRVEDCLLA